VSVRGAGARTTGYWRPKAACRCPRKATGKPPFRDLRWAARNFPFCSANGKANSGVSQAGARGDMEEAIAVYRIRRKNFKSRCRLEPGNCCNFLKSSGFLES
jgi:hypothetical protein